MTHIFAIANQKGGVGKTTTTVNLAASLAATKRNVLVVDLDPQGNATMGCGVDKYAAEVNVCDVLLGEASCIDTIQPVEPAGLFVLPSNSDLTAAEIELIQMEQRENRLGLALAEVSEKFDYILIDCPPTLNMLTINALAAATGVVIPMQCEYYALEGLSALLDTVEKIRSTINPSLQVEGLLRAMFDPRNKLAIDVSNQLESHFGDKVYRTLIPRNVRLAEAPSFGQPVILYDKASRGAMAYLALAGEILRKQHQSSDLAATGTGS